MLQSDSGLWSQSIQADSYATSWLYLPPFCSSFHLFLWNIFLFSFGQWNFSNMLVLSEKKKREENAAQPLFALRTPSPQSDCSLPQSPLSLSPLMKPNELPYWQNHIAGRQPSELESTPELRTDGKSGYREEGCAGGVPVSASVKDGMWDDISPCPVDLIRPSGAVQPGGANFQSDGEKETSAVHKFTYAKYQGKRNWEKFTWTWSLARHCSPECNCHAAVDSSCFSIGVSQNESKTSLKILTEKLRFALVCTPLNGETLINHDLVCI